MDAQEKLRDMLDEISAIRPRVAFLANAADALGALDERGIATAFSGEEWQGLSSLLSDIGERLAALEHRAYGALDSGGPGGA